MKIYSIVSQSHEAMIPMWKVSALADPEIEPIIVPLSGGGDGDYSNAQWLSIMRKCNEAVHERIKANIGSNIGISGVDVVYLRPFVTEIEELLLTHDICAQRERPHDELFNPDVMFIKCTDRAVGAWSRWLDSMDQWDGHLVDQNRLMRKAFSGLSVHVLAAKYANPSNGGLHDKPVLFHANCCPPPDSVRKKIAMLESINILMWADGI